MLWHFGSAATFTFSGAGAVPVKLTLPAIVPFPLVAAGAPAAVVEGGAAWSVVDPPPHAAGSVASASSVTAFWKDIS
jgi:hypothetical protein